jgi:exodeoxyribonuclease V alpha subunit
MKIEIQRIVYANDDGFLIGKARVLDGPNEGRIISVKGNFPGEVEKNLCYEGDAKKEHHPRYGEQWLLRNAVEVQPASEAGVLRWLQRKGVPFRVGVGLLDGGAEGILERATSPVALKAAGASDEEVQAVIEALTAFDGVKLLRDIPGFGEKRVKALLDWANNAGVDLDKLLQDNPYRLLDAPGIGWVLADAAAKGLGMAEDDPRRLAAAPEYVLSQNERDGHTWMSKDEMLSKTSEILALPSHRVVDAIMTPGIYTPVVMDGERAWRAATHKAERGLAWGINALVDTTSPIQEKLLSVLAAGDVFEGLPFALSQEQREAVAHTCTHKVSILTGGAGTGKSTITKIVVDAFEKAAGEGSIVLCSPTGKAAKRLTEVTGRKARTIHSALYASSGDNPLINEYTALVVVDEASMLDTIVGEWLIRNVPTTAHVVFVGDDNQLPSVGPGRVLHDLQTAGVPTFRLQETHRNDGAILSVVYGALWGRVPPIDNSSDVLLYEVPDPDTIPAVVCRVASEARQNGTCKVIAPQRSRTVGQGCGWNTLNLHLQGLLNPAAQGKAEVRWFGAVLREGDELLWTDTNKKAGLVNGDEVIARTLKSYDKVFKVELDNGHTFDLDDLTAVHGYACTTHKAQGSEYDTVVFVCHSSHQWMLTQRQVYTALSRARRRLVIIGERDALDKASRNLRDAGRNTALVDFMEDSNETS